MSKFILRVVIVRSFDVSSSFSTVKTNRVPRTQVCLESTSRADHSRKTCNGNDQTTSRPNGSPNKDKSSFMPPLILLEMAIEISTSVISDYIATYCKSQSMINFYIDDENVNRKFRSDVILV